MKANASPAGVKFVVFALVGVALLGGLAKLVLSGKPKDVSRVAHADPALQAASKKAQSELPHFLSELADPKPGEGFAVKGAFKTPAGLEYLWVKSPEFKDDAFTGILDQQPIALKDKQKGDIVRVPKKDVYDWLIKDDDGIHGMYTEKVLQGS